MITWTKEKAKKFMVNYHFLNSTNPLSGHEGIKEVFSRIPSIQYDPLDVVGRNADLVLQSRINNYSRRLLQEALYEERYLIDGWDKMLGIYQTKDFTFMEPVRKSRSEGELRRFSYHGIEDAVEIIDEVIKEFETGPKFVSEISLGQVKKNVWGSSKASTGSLEYLFHKGVIGIKNKKGSLRQFDLIENLFNFEKFTHTNFEEEYCYRRILSMGLVWNKSSVVWSGPFIDKKVSRTKILKSLLANGKITQIQVEDVREPFYVPTKYLYLEEKVDERISFIAPLDNFIWDRALIKEVFDFEYTWEVYTPIKKRKYGYYVLPMLYKDEFIGRIEFKHFRGEKLELIDVWWEKKPKKRILNKAIKRFEEYLRRGEYI